MRHARLIAWASVALSFMILAGTFGCWLIGGASLSLGPYLYITPNAVFKAASSDIFDCIKRASGKIVTVIPAIAVSFGVCTIAASIV